MTSAGPPEQVAASPWWSPQRHADRRPFLQARERIRRRLRDFLDGEGFQEVDTAALQVSPGNEAHLHAFATALRAPDGAGSPMFLHTSPEFACKKLLAAGETRIFDFAHVFRDRERGRLHHPEFTLLEWYRVGEDYTALMRDCAALVASAALTTGIIAFTWRGRACDPFAAPQRLTVAQAFQRYAGIDLLASLAGEVPDRPAFAAAATAAGIRLAADDTWSDIFSRVLVERIEPQLGNGAITILDEYPVVEAALARPSPRDPRVAERFELYACGMELANAFGELTDPAEQRRRFLAEMAEKERLYGEHYPLDEEFLAALAIMPPACGCALGFDRLVMLATGATDIEQVLWTPVACPRP